MKTDKQICEHHDLTYLDYQEELDGPGYYLYNCGSCHTTLAFPSLTIDLDKLIDIYKMLGRDSSE